MYKYRSVALFWNLALAKSTDFFQDISFKENEIVSILCENLIKTARSNRKVVVNK